MPYAARRAVLGDFFEEVAVSVEEERKLRTEFVEIHSTTERVLDVFHAVAQGEGEFLNGGRAGLANVVTADGNGIELGCFFDREFEGVNHQAHGWFGRVDVFLLRDVFLEDVVLQSAGDLFPVRALFFRDGEIHRPDDCGGGNYGHGSGEPSRRGFKEK